MRRSRQSKGFFKDFPPNSQVFSRYYTIVRFTKLKKYDKICKACFWTWGGTMRVITGSARGCRLKTPKGQATRPTADRIKESLFNILGRRSLGAQVLDLFAGTGALGLEALSRGAAAAVFVDHVTAPLLRENAERTHLSERAEILRGDALRVLGRLGGQGRSFDLIFCDPPYRLGLWEKALVSVDRAGLLAPAGLMVVEHGADEDVLPLLSALQRVRSERYGKTTQLSFFERLRLQGGEA